MQPLWKRCQKFFIQLNIAHYPCPMAPKFSNLLTQEKQTYVYTKIYIGKFTTLVIMNNNQKPKLPKLSSNRSIENKSWYIHMLDYSAIKKPHSSYTQHEWISQALHWTKEAGHKKSVHTVWFPLVRRSRTGKINVELKKLKF